MKLSDGVCAVVYNHSKKALMMGMKGSARSWQFPNVGWRFPVGEDDDGQEALNKQFGIEFVSVSNDVYTEDSADIHRVDCGKVIIPVDKRVRNGKVYARQREYSDVSVYSYEYNKNAVNKVAKGIKDKEVSKVRWVKLSDMFKRELAPETLVVLNCFINSNKAVANEYGRQS